VKVVAQMAIGAVGAILEIPAVVAMIGVDHFITQFTIFQTGTIDAILRSPRPIHIEGVFTFC
jgi:hypothetical protein